MMDKEEIKLPGIRASDSVGFTIADRFTVTDVIYEGKKARYVSLKCHYCMNTLAKVSVRVLADYGTTCRKCRNSIGPSPLTAMDNGGLSWEEIGEILNIPPAQAKRECEAALRKFRQEYLRRIGYNTERPKGLR